MKESTHNQEMKKLLYNGIESLVSEISELRDENTNLLEQLANMKRRVNIAITGAEVTSDLNAALRAENTSMAEQLKAARDNAAMWQRVESEKNEWLNKIQCDAQELRIENSDLRAENERLLATMHQIKMNSNESFVWRIVDDALGEDKQ